MECRSKNDRKHFQLAVGLMDKRGFSTEVLAIQQHLPCATTPGVKN